MPKHRNKPSNSHRDSRQAARENRRNSQRGAANEDNAILNIQASIQFERDQKSVFRKDFKPRSMRQQACLDMIERKRLSFVTGPSGTGKTFLAMFWAVEQFANNQIEKILISRPMVGCDEDVGALPGTEFEKFKPWLGPLLEIAEGRLGKARVATMIEYGELVCQPLMDMRGSTFRNTIVILDEAQNTTKKQMKMFLTRIGEGSRVIVTGDAMQNDLKEGIESGLTHFLQGAEESARIGIFKFTKADVVRDPLVAEILDIYEELEAGPIPDELREKSPTLQAVA